MKLKNKEIQINSLLCNFLKHIFWPLNLLGSFLGVIRNRSSYLEGRERPKKKADHSGWEVVGLISKGPYSRGLSWAAADQICAPPRQILEGYMEALPGFSPTW